MSPRKLSVLSALLAGFSMAATPLAAADLPAPGGPVSPVPTFGAWDAGSVNADRHRWHRYRRDRTSVGDLLAGVLIIGGIAAVASAATKNSRYRYRDYRYPDRSYEYRTRGESGYSDSRGINRAVDMCLNEIESQVRVERVDSVDRTAEGWRVSGVLYDGEGFACRIGNDGQIAGIDYGRGAAWDEGFSYGAEDRQYDDDRYARAWRARDAAAASAQPAYPGGPMRGDGAAWDAELDSVRYSDGKTPDFRY